MDYEIRKDVPMPPKGLVATLRQMECGDSTVIPASQHVGIHACARSVGAKVRTRSNDDGTVTVWRIDPPIEVEGNIFGENSIPVDAGLEPGADPAGDIFK